MMQDDRNNAEAAAGLLSMPTSVVDQMDERHGKFQSRLGLFGHLLSGNDKSTYGDADLQAQFKADKAAYDSQQAMQLLGQQFEGLDINNPTMAQVAAITQLDAGLGKQALANFTFNQQVGDLGKAQGFLNDGIEDENDLWAREANLRYGRTAAGDQTSLSAVLDNAKMTQAQFDALPAESQRRVLYQHGTDEDRRNADIIAGRKTIDQIEAEAQAGKEGDARGVQVGEDRKTLVGIRGIIQAQDQGIEKLSEIRDGLEDDDVSTGWPRIIRDAMNVNTREDGTMDEATASGVIDLISQATFGALSQSELDLLKGGLMDPTKSTEYNIGTLNSAIERIQKEQEISYQKARDAAKRYEGNDDYDQLMEDDWMFQNIGAGSQIEAIPAFGGNEAYTFNEYVEDTMSELGPFDQKPTRDELVAGFGAQRKEAEEMYRAAQEREEAASKAANESWDWLTSPFPAANK